MNVNSFLLDSILLYYFIVNTTYLFLLFAAVHAIRKQNQVRPLIESLSLSFPAFAPSISILAPAYNEEATIVESVKSFLMMNYPNHEVVVINDGSKDSTLSTLIESFGLKATILPYDPSLSKTKIRGVYSSEIHPNLVVIDKENGGKADALNVGLGYAQFEIFCAVDSDSLLEEQALMRVALPFLEEPNRTIASGGTIRIANGAEVKYGRVSRIELPNNFLVLMQIIEYTRAFLCGRIGWNAFNSTIVISGAFGLFSKRAVREIGGYTTGSIGEDMELVVRLHRRAREMKRDYSIVFIPDPVCWTEAPGDLASLQKQRDRWQRGLADTLIRNRGMFLNPRYGFLGMVTFPYFLIVELLGPVIEIFALLYVGYLWTIGVLDMEWLVVFLMIGILYGALLSIAAVVIEEMYFCKYTKVRQFVALFCVSLVEAIGYRQLSSYWRILGLYKYLRGDHTWGKQNRVGFAKGKAS